MTLTAYTPLRRKQILMPGRARSVSVGESIVGAEVSGYSDYNVAPDASARPP